MKVVASDGKLQMRAQVALRRAFIARLIGQMRRAGVLRALMRKSFGAASAIQVSLPHPRVPNAYAILQPLRRSGVAAGGAGGGGPGVCGDLKWTECC